MADKKIEKALYGPSLTEVALGAILGLGVGVVGAAVYLIFKPVMTVKELPKEPIRNVLYYIPGADGNAKGKSWTAKQKSFLAGTSVTLVEDELNLWAAQAFSGAPATPPPKTPPPKGAPPAAPAEAPKPALNGIFNPGTPNFKIKDGKLQMGTKCVLNWYGLTAEVTVVTTGDLVKSGDKFIYAPRTLYLG